MQPAVIWRKLLEWHGRHDVRPQDKAHIRSVASHDLYDGADISLITN